MEIGVIALWSGLIADIPKGHQLCDGTNGTPDLRAKFIRGAVDQSTMGDTGGSDSQTHSYTGNGHTHNIVPAGGVETGATFNTTTSNTAESGTTNASDNRPAFYTLAYIMRLS